VTSHFDEIAEHYDASIPEHVSAHYLEKRTKFVQEHSPGSRVLDVGCGTGVLAARLAELGFQAVGADPSQRMLDVMKRRAPGLEAVLASGTELPFPDGSFDLALSVAAFHHIADPEAIRSTVNEMARVVRPGGRVLIWDHNPRNPYWPYIMRRVPQDVGEERLIPLRELLDAVEAAGARPILVRETGLVPDFTPAWSLRPAAWIEGVVERAPLLRRLCAHNVVLAERDLKP
jgi:ubiquinone/menaquinone biosynthesis C-methylase UbiE